MPVKHGRLVCCVCGADLGDADDPYRDPACGECLRRESEADAEHDAPHECDTFGPNWSLLDATEDSLREHMLLVKELRTTVRTLVGFLDRDSLRDAERDPMLREERERERQHAVALLER